MKNTVTVITHQEGEQNVPDLVKSIVGITEETTIWWESRAWGSDGKYMVFSTDRKPHRYAYRSEYIQSFEVKK